MSRYARKNLAAMITPFAVLVVCCLFNPSSSPGNIRFVRYSTLKGLSSYSQTCVAQDKEGFIWIGTDDGLNRFDGYTFKVYRENPADSSSLRSNIIDCLYVDSHDNLWVGTYGGGLSLYDKKKDDFYTYPQLRGNNITCLTEDKHGRLWIGTSVGLYMLNLKTQRFKEYVNNPADPLDPGTIAPGLVDVMALDSNVIWIAYSSGMLSALNTTSMKFKHYRMFHVASSETADFSANALVLDNNRIWMSTWSKGIWIFNKKTGVARQYKREKSRYINFIFKDRKNRIWYSPESDGLVLVDGKQKIDYKEEAPDPNSISSNLLSSMFEDREGNLWITSKLGDLNCAVFDSPFHNWFKNPGSRYGLTSNLVYAIMEDSRNRIWVGYQDGGIDILDAKNGTLETHFGGNNSSGLGPGPVMDIFESRNGTIWVGKYLDGLKKYDERTRSFISFEHRDGNDRTIAGNDVRYISEDSRGNLWIAIHGGGVDRFNPKTGVFTHYKHDNNSPATTIPSDWTYTALCDRHGDIWVGSVAGVSVLSEQGKVIKQYTGGSSPDNLSSNLAYDVFVDSKDRVWIGTADGLNQLNPRTGIIRRYLTGNGLPGNQIMGVLEDRSHNIWVGTTSGLFRIDPGSHSFKTFSIEDGLATNEFSRLASFKDRNGNMYFGGRGGLTCFNPESIRVNDYKPPVYLTDFKLFNRDVSIAGDRTSKGFTIPRQIDYSKAVTLDYNQNVITLEFAALNYISPEKNKYKYELVGFDKRWSPAGYKREVTYTNLDPGKYTFRVIASNNDGIWNKNGASLEILVKPPFWRTDWAYVLYFSFAIMLLYAFRRLTLHEAGIKRKLEFEELEIQKLHEMDLLKMQFFANVSHEFRTPLTLIIGPMEQLLRDAKDELQKLQLKLVSRNARRLLRLINQMMDFRKIEEATLQLNPTKNDVVLFVKDIVESFNQDATQRNINFTFIHSHPSLDVWFDTDKLDKIVYNLLANAFKYTRDNGSIAVSLDIEGACYPEGTAKQNGNGSSPDNRTLKISVKDTGIGIPMDARNRIFDRFYQVKNSLTSAGTGIGLSLTYELITLHHGSISVESELDKGSEFTVVLPLWLDEADLPQNSHVPRDGEAIAPRDRIPFPESETGEERAQNGQQDRKGSPKILIIEDNADMRLFIKSLLKDNYNICEASDGIIGLQKAYEEMPDAIICDVMMPGKDGYEVCRTLKNDEPTSHIPIVLLTAKGSEQHTIEGFESGADDYVAKPFSAAVLKARIKNLIEARNLLRKKFMKDPFAGFADMSPSRTDEQLFRKVYSIVEKNLGNPDFDVNDFASELGMSRTQLYRKINALSGESPKEFVRVLRLKKASELLVGTDSNVSEVAYSVGFNSLSYFTTAFTEYFGMNPTTFIKKQLTHEATKSDDGSLHDT